MTTEIFLAESDAEIDSCYPAFSALRPHVRREDFLSRVRRQELQSYRILALRHEGSIPSAAGFRNAEFLAWGRVLYVDDLTTLPEARGKGFAGALLDWLIAHAKGAGFDAVHLDTGYGRHAAHRLYLSRGFELNCHHMAADLRKPVR
jgi:GNAT superfamily N-acetyltransferase